MHDDSREELRLSLADDIAQKKMDTVQNREVYTIQDFALEFVLEVVVSNPIPTVACGNFDGGQRWRLRSQSK